jgi:hypothetical protein
MAEARRGKAEIIERGMYCREAREIARLTGA